jgi:hypothetical protein
MDLNEESLVVARVGFLEKKGWLAGELKTLFRIFIFTEKTSVLLPKNDYDLGFLKARRDPSTSLLLPYSTYITSCCYLSCNFLQRSKIRQRQDLAAFIYNS